MSNRISILAENGWRGALYFALFPLDLFGPDTDERLAYQQAKVEELVPFLGWLCPLLVLLSSSTLMGSGGLLIFLSLEAFLIAGVTKFHLRLATNQWVEVWLNLWLSMLGFAVLMSLLAGVLGLFSAPSFNWG
ncbi:MAG: hypothetical protein VKN33_03770 [Candidatus Sericytochromatia bacterium]|nr:hypothetical protein [Candidatus Sericytochromatia bacterium]